MIKLKAKMIFVSIDNHWKSEILKAIEQELKNWRAFDVYKNIQNSGVIGKLNKTAFGLDDATRNWHFNAKDDLSR